MGDFQLTFFHIFSFLTLFLTPVVLQNSKGAVGLPLSTDSRWVVDEHGHRVKLACVNWPAHLETLVAEGLDKQPLDTISQKISSMGFNCARLTWPSFLLSNISFRSLSVIQSFKNLGLNKAIAGLQTKNPSLLDLSVIKALQAVVESLGKSNVMVILDNHLSRPGWCCSGSDGNGFFGDTDFNPELWLQALTQMATNFKGVKNVVGMSLRNELRGPKQNIPDWYRYMQQGAEAVHSANPDVLVILSGLQYDIDLSFLRNQLPKLSFARKVVYEVHRYSWFGDVSLEADDGNGTCGPLRSKFMSLAGFVLEKGLPLFVSEFGVDQRLTSEREKRFWACFSAILADLDLDWAIWGLQGSYYLRQGAQGMEEYFGVLDRDWNQIRNPTFFKRITSIQTPSKANKAEEYQG